MKIAVFGTGMVGQALAGKLSGARPRGHRWEHVTSEATLARTEPGPLGSPPFGVWREDLPRRRTGSRRQTPLPAPS